MEIISLNCNKLNIITQYILYNSIYMGQGGGGLLKRGAYFIFSLNRRSLREGGLFERGLNREITAINEEIRQLLRQLIKKVVVKVISQ